MEIRELIITVRRKDGSEGKIHLASGTLNFLTKCLSLATKFGIRNPSNPKEILYASLNFVRIQMPPISV